MNTDLLLRFFYWFGSGGVLLLDRDLRSGCFESGLLFGQNLEQR